MRTLSESELLDIWEHSYGESAARSAIRLLAAVCSDASEDELWSASIGLRDSLLMQLRMRTFGTRVTCLAKCPSCGDSMELRFDITDILDRSEALPVRPVSLSGYQVQFRLPTALDLATVAGISDPALARQTMIKMCILSSTFQGEAVFTDHLPNDVVKAVAQKISQSDPGADIQISITCVSCSHNWHGIFDISSFFRDEINCWALRTLREVHNLAIAYGWREEDILAMSQRRRQIYLEMAA